MERFNIDHDLHQVIEPPKDVIMPTLKSIRWGMEHNVYGRRPLSRPRGDFIFKMTDAEIKHYATQKIEVPRPNLGISKADALLDHIAKNGDY